LGESVLIDTGSLEPAHRDADRIIKACGYAGLKHIDYLVTTHFHSDHFGAILEVSERIPIKCFMDKGALPPQHEQENERFKQLYPLYLQATNADIKTVRARDDIPLRNDPTGRIPKVSLHCVAAEKQVEGFDGNVDAPRKGIQPNTFAALKSLPSLEAIYQIHYNTQYGAQGNTADEFIANRWDPKKGELIKVSVDPAGGVFAVSIGVTGPKKEFHIQ